MTNDGQLHNRNETGLILPYKVMDSIPTTVKGRRLNKCNIAESQRVYLQ